MPLAPGTQLGPYEIGAPLGAGGMGEVYRARDTRLDRTVAIKILPAQFSSDPVCKQRFEREAKIISSLNHPHICVLYDVGHQNGIDYLVMECVEGETLAKRLEKGPLTLELVLKYGMQIADALDKAHRSGVVHRDLKPGNVMLTPTGAKLLDFGLAKPVAPIVSAASLTAATQPSAVTEQGSIVGTFQYMSPEQVEGREIDSRSDIFSLGAVLYEMLTGKPAFTGKNHFTVAAAILDTDPPPISSIKPMTPPALDQAIRGCLAKDPDERWQRARDLSLQLKWIAEPGSQTGVPAVATRGARTPWPWITAGIVLLALIAGTGLTYFWRTVPLQRVARSSILPPENLAFSANASEWASVAVSPDGTRLVVGVVGQTGREILYVRPLDTLSGQILAGTEGATFPFWSADGRSIGFFANGQLQTVDSSGGPVREVCPAPQGRGATWSKDGIIVFAPSPYTGLLRVAATGGAPVAVTKLDSLRHEDSHRWPQFLPDGRHFLYLARTSDRSSSEIQVGSIDSVKPLSIVRANGNPVFAPSGFLLYPRGNALIAEQFDADHFRISGEPVIVADQISTNGNVDFSAFSASANGVLVYKRGIGEGVSQLIWTDRSGKILEKVGEPGAYLGPSLSPDGRKLAVEIDDPRVHANSDIWIYDLARHSKTRLTFSQANKHNRLPVWSPDGSQIVFSSDRDGHSQQIYEKAVNGTEAEHVLSPGDGDRYPASWSPDGRYVAGIQQNPERGTEFLLLPVLGIQKPIDFLPAAVGISRFSFPRISPDGKWISYSSFESGRAELYISSFPSGSGKWQVSTNGSRDSVWRKDGKEIFYETLDDTLMAVEISEEKGSPVIGKARTLFRIRVASSPHWVYDVSPGGNRFLINSLQLGSTPEPLTLIVNWDAGLEKK